MPDNDEYKAQYTDEQIFDMFGVGPESASLPMRKFIHGQRLVNGRLYVAIDKILDHLLEANPEDKGLQDAKKYNDEVPGKPPACDPGGG